MRSKKKKILKLGLFWPFLLQILLKENLPYIQIDFLFQKISIDFFSKTSFDLRRPSTFEWPNEKKELYRVST